MENTEMHNENTELNYDESVIAKIVGKTMANIQGVLSVEGNIVENLMDRFRDSKDETKGIKVELNDEDKTASLDLHAVVEYGRNVPKIFQETIKEVEKEIGKMTDITVSSFKMTVSDLMTKDEWQEKQRKEEQSSLNRDKSERHHRDEHPSGHQRSNDSSQMNNWRETPDLEGHPRHVEVD